MKICKSCTTAIKSLNLSTGDEVSRVPGTTCAECGEWAVDTTRPLVAVAEELDVTYRQLDNWSRQGYIKTTFRSAHNVELPTEGGSGYRRRVSQLEYQVARLLSRLVTAGISLQVAGPKARAAIYRGETTIALDNDLMIVPSSGRW